MSGIYLVEHSPHNEYCMRKLSVVVPVYNEAEALPHTVDRLLQVAESLIATSVVGTIEFTFVNDGSSDGTYEILSRQKSKIENAKGCSLNTLHFSRNFGHSSAVFAGLENSDGDLIAVIDADLQDPPELLAPMIETMDRTGADVVYGQRVNRGGEGVFKKLSAWAFYRLINILSGVSIPTDTGDFRVMTREVCDAVCSLQEREPFLRGLVAWVGFKQIGFHFERQERKYGVTKYPLRKMLRFAAHAILSFSVAPLRLAIYFGLMGMFASLALSIYAFFYFWTGSAIPGWASTIVGFTVGQSTTLLVVGIIGLYLGRVHGALQNRPRYILKKESKRGPRYLVKTGTK